MSIKYSIYSSVSSILGLLQKIAYIIVTSYRLLMKVILTYFSDGVRRWLIPFSIIGRPSVIQAGAGASFK